MKIERRKIAELKNDPANARKHSPRNLKAIRDSLDVFGQQKPIVVDSRGVVIAGNGTLEAARELGWDEIDVAVTDLDPAHAQAFGIADNRTAELAEWDTDVLGQLLEGMDRDLADILSMDDLELPDNIDGGGQGEGLTDPDEVPEPPEEPITQTGDLWLLGEHRLLCGDSTSAEDVGRLMDGAKAGGIVTDPPYGIGIDGQKESVCKNPKHNRKAHAFMGWDSERPPQSVFSYMLSMQCPTAIFGGNYFADMLPASRGWIYWSKGQDGLSMSDGELAWTTTTKPLRCVTVNRAALHGSVHPTQKPVEVIAFAVAYIDPEDGPLYDPFLGSGTTLIAAEQLGRKCYGMEIEPKYCDVIVKRWEDFTGQTATRETASQTATRENERT